jgi:hypothetical protein
LNVIWATADNVTVVCGPGGKILIFTIARHACEDQTSCDR